ncbi:hypothetical protein HY768_02730 [candidate division TA06 bacterium]|uniref:Uncharacterized protein n=1 Tax=candidate division TA06 bacterium TaxID=2250710 RepID=A0A933I9E6_UNCT6|nr:hypothetical protein [candidate division TA06 bacterium]
MYNKIDTYHFILNTGQDFYGKVLAQDDLKMIVATAKDSKPARRLIIYHQAMLMAETVKTPFIQPC